MAAAALRCACLALALATALGSPAKATKAKSADAKTCPSDPWTVTRLPERFDPEYRLARDVLPQHYDVRIDVNIGDGGKFNFDGHVLVLVVPTEPTNKIYLHSVDLQVDPVHVVEWVGDENGKEGKEGKEVAVRSQTINTEQEQLRLELGDKLVPHKKYLVKIEFKGNLRNDLNGLYRSSYYDKATNSTRWLAVTQFEATYARRAFPCFDEPDFKATFTIQIGHNANLTALSNMPADKSVPLEGRPGFNLTSFPKTVPMSTYLVAVIVSDFYTIKADKEEGRAQTSIIGRRESASQMGYAKEIAPKALAFFEDYFDIKYPLPKQDMVAIPDFSAGAMENWGLITYREAQLLFDSEASSQTTKASVAGTVVHELAHQWFGNLVTMKWWSDLWLNEGFATYMATLGTSHLHPDWHIMEDNAVTNTLSVMPLDALESTHPVVRPIENGRQISQSFDTITYKKGSGLLRMIHSFLGERAFREGVSNYLKQHAYNNAEQDDLWEHLTASAHKDGSLPTCLSVKAIMDTWTVQSGFPVVTVTRDYAKGTANVSQERYFSSTSKSREVRPECWYVPLSYVGAPDVASAALDSKTRPPQEWLTCKDAVQSVSGMPAKDKWVLFNLNMGGLYRVLYDEENWRLITAALADPKQRHGIPAVTRAQVIDDALELAQTQRVSHAVSLQLINTMNLEDEYLPWRVALGGLGRLENLLKNDVRYHVFRAWVRGILRPVFEKQGRLRERVNGFQATKLKNLITTWACKMEVGDCLEQSRELFAQWRATPNPDTNNPIPQDHRTLVYCYAIRHGKSQDWHWLWQRYLKSNVASARVAILSALGCSRDIWVLQRYLHWSVNNGSGVRTQDSHYVFNAVASTEVGYPVAKKFLFEHAEDIVKLHGPTSDRIGRYVTSITNYVITTEEYDQLVEYTKKNNVFFASANEAVKRGLEAAYNHVQWVKEHADELYKTIATFSIKQHDSAEASDASDLD